MKSILKSTTSLTLCLSLALPTGGFAQSAPEACLDTPAARVFPCVTPDGEVVETVKQFQRYRGNADKAAAEAEAADSDTDQPAQAEAAPAVNEPRVSPDDATAEEAANREAKRLEEELKRQQAEAAEAQRQQEVAAEKARQQAEADEQARKKAQAAEEAADQESKKAAKAAKAAKQQAAKKALTPEQKAAKKAAREARQQAAREARKEAAKEARQQARQQARRDARATAAAAADADTDADVEVTTEEVTADNSRSSNQEFDTSVTGAPTAAATSDKSGLSKFETALLLGLGAVVVGSLLKNGDKVVSRSGDRVVVERDGDLRVLKNDDALLRQPGSEVTTETFNDGSTRTIVDRPDGSSIVTIRGADGTVLSRTKITPEGEAIVLFDDTIGEREIVVSELPKARQSNFVATGQDERALRLALQSELRGAGVEAFSLRQVRNISQVRALAPEIELDAVRFETGSAAIQPQQARSLARIGQAIQDMIAEDPRTVILVEGHTDAVGSASYNLALSDRRAETVALALTEYFDVPPENMIVQGYGESALKVQTEFAEPANRRAVVRNITNLLH